MAAPQAIMEGVQVSYAEVYTPAAGIITSTALANKTLEYAYFMTAADGDVTVECYGRNTVTLTVKGGVPYPIAVRRITAAAGVVYILHNGK